MISHMERCDRMDEIDRTILSMLQENGKLSSGEIGSHVGLSVSGVKERLRKLQEKGVIQKYVAVLGPKHVGLGVCSFVLVEFDTYEHEQSFQEQILTMPEVQECHHVTGQYSFLLKIRVEDNQKLENFLGENLKSMPGLQHIDTIVSLSPVKETTSMMLS